MAIFPKRPTDTASTTPSAKPAVAPPPQAAPPPARPRVESPPLAQFLRESEVRTSIGADAVINGKLSFNTPTRVEGKLKGELRCTQLLIIGATAVVEGWVHAEELQVEGVVRGEISALRRVEIREQGRFNGRLTAEVLVVREGGLCDGELHVGPGAAASVEERQRSGSLPG